ncbi:hypothetical protein R1080702_120 [Cyanophage S-RIM32]|uniref:Virion structural protein n=1 Tax=Cyanophage S-RIM32 TaxID=1278479 RepID=A0A127KMF5_9CAUD|nr:virion structural protein [Cyanophage S-RIM32]AMO43129.1 hypothetical protein R1080702_120 [Cyanophage S-RIM32]
MAQYSKHYEDFLPQEKTNFEVVMIADNFGNLTAGTGATAVDAFGRLRVAETFTLGDYKHLYAIDPNFLDLKENGGDIQYNQNKACAVMTTTSNVASRAVHQTKFYHHYQPGKSQVIFSSVCFGYAQQNVTKRTGYYDDRDGIYFEQVGDNDADGTTNGTLNFVVRSYTGGSASEATVGTYKRRVPQSEWNIDPCDGTGPSKFDINTSKTQLVYTDFQWLGVGRVRCGFVHNGQIVLAHEYYCSNELAEVYISNPNLPVRCEMLNTGTTAGGSMDQICSTVMSEGGYVESGIDWAITSPGVRATKTPGGTRFPILAIRLKNLFNNYPNRISVRPNTLGIFAQGEDCYYELIKLSSATQLTTTLNSGVLTWVDADTNSGVQYCANAEAIVGAVDVFAAGIVTAGSSPNSLTPVASGGLTTAKKNIIVQNIDSTDSEVFVIAVKTISTAGNATADVAATVQWREIY